MQQVRVEAVVNAQLGEVARATVAHLYNTNTRRDEPAVLFGMPARAVKAMERPAPPVTCVEVKTGPTR
eukprot:4028207-Lingulodinium_polyedra.AAC.1